MLKRAHRARTYRDEIQLRDRQQPPGAGPRAASEANYHAKPRGDSRRCAQSKSTRFFDSTARTLGAQRGNAIKHGRARAHTHTYELGGKNNIFLRIHYT